MIYAPDDRHRTIGSRRIILDGNDYPLDGIPTRSLTLEPGQRSTCSPATDALIPKSLANRPARVDITFGGKRTTFYHGLTTTRKYTVAQAIARETPATDILIRTERTLRDACGTDEGIIFENTPWTDGVRMLLNRAGISDSEIARIHDPNPAGSPTLLNLGSVERICHEPGETISAILGKVLEAGCSTMRCLPASGKVEVLPITRLPNAAPNLHFSNTDSDCYRWISVTETYGGAGTIVERYTCTGAQVTGGIAATDTWVAEGIEGTSDSTTNPYWQTVPQCQWAAEYYGKLACREERIFEVEAPLDPDVIPGMNCLITAQHAGLDAQPAFISAVRSSGTTMTLTCLLGPSSTGEAYAPPPAPICDFSLTVVAERVLIGGTPTTIYEVAVVDHSTSPSGSIDWSNESSGWSVSGATPLNTPKRAAESLMVLTSLTGVFITLTVVDDQEQTCSLTQPLDAPGVTVFWRTLHATMDGRWGVLPKETWVWWTPPGAEARAVSRYNETGPLMMGDSLGRIWTRSQEDLNQEPVQVASLDEAITDLYVGETLSNPAASSSIIAAHGTRASWTHDAWATIAAYDFGSPVTGVAIDPYTTTHLTVLVGNAVKESYDDGRTWGDLLVGATGSTATDLAVAPWDTCVTFSGASGDDALRFVSGATWSGITLDGQPQSVTPGVRTQTFRVATSTSRVYLFTRQEDGSYLGQEIGQVNASGNTHRIVRDGSMPLIYGADATRLFKQLDDDPTQVYPLAIASGSGGRQIGYGRWGTPQSFLSLELFLAPWGQTNSSLDKLWHYVPDQGWEGLALPRAGWYWQNVIVSPDGQYLALLGNDSNHNDTYPWSYDGTTVSSWNGRYPPIYYRHIADSAWTAVTLGVNGAQINTPDGIKAGCGWLEFVGNSLFCAGTVVRTDGRLVSFLDKVVIGGSTMANTTHTLFNYAGLKSAFGGAVVMQDGRIVFAVPSSDPNYMYYAEYPALVAYRPRMTDAFTAYGATIGDDTIIFANGGNLLGEGQLYSSANFTTTSVAQRFASGIAYSVDSNAQNQVFIASGWTQEIRRIDEITGAWSATVAERSSLPGASKIRSDRQTKTRLSALHADGIVVRGSDGTWTNVAFPPGVERAKVAWCEPVMRER